MNKLYMWNSQIVPLISASVHEVHPQALWLTGTHFFCFFLHSSQASVPPHHDHLHTVFTLLWPRSTGSPVFISEPGPVGPHSELPEELTEPLLDVGPLLSAFIRAGPLSSSEAVAVVNSRVVEARHRVAGRRTESLDSCGIVSLWVNRKTRCVDARSCSRWLFRGKNSTPSRLFPASRFSQRPSPVLWLAGSDERPSLLVRAVLRRSVLDLEVELVSSDGAKKTRGGGGGGARGAGQCNKEEWIQEQIEVQTATTAQQKTHFYHLKYMLMMFFRRAFCLGRIYLCLQLA